MRFYSVVVEPHPPPLTSLHVLLSWLSAALSAWKWLSGREGGRGKEEGREEGGKEGEREGKEEREDSISTPLPNYFSYFSVLWL